MSTKLKQQLEKRLERQKAAIAETQEQLDWVKQLEAGQPAKK